MLHVDKYEVQAACRRRGKTLADMATMLKISQPTLRKKLRQDELTVADMDRITQWLDRDAAWARRTFLSDQLPELDQDKQDK